MNSHAGWGSHYFSQGMLLLLNDFIENVAHKCMGIGMCISSLFTDGVPNTGQRVDSDLNNKSF